MKKTTYELFALLAFLLDFVEGLGEALERILVGRGRAAARGALHRQVGALAHGIDHGRLLGDVLDPGAVVLRVHRELFSTDLGGVGGCGAVAGFGGCCAKAPDASDVATMNAVAANRIPVIGPPA